MENNTNNASRGEIVIYQTVDGTTSIDVRFENDTVWLTQDQMKTLFQRDKSVISRHIRDIFNEGELDPEVVVAKNATTTRHGAIADKTQTHEKLVYNLDVIISVGYRVKSKRGTQFRIWATSVLKEYLIKGYAVRSNLAQQALAPFQPFLHIGNSLRQILLEGGVFVQEGRIAVRECNKKVFGHGIGIFGNGILYVVHFLFGSGVLIDLQLLMKEGVGLFHGRTVNHITRLYFS